MNKCWTSSKFIQPEVLTRKFTRSNRYNLIDFQHRRANDLQSHILGVHLSMKANVIAGERDDRSAEISNHSVHCQPSFVRCLGSWHSCHPGTDLQVLQSPPAAISRHDLDTDHLHPPTRGQLQPGVVLIHRMEEMNTCLGYLAIDCEHWTPIIEISLVNCRCSGFNKTYIYIYTYKKLFIKML